MHDVSHAISVLRDKIGLKDFALNHEGHAELIFDSRLPVDFYKIDEGTLELSSIIDDPDPDISREKLIALLTANYLGDATGHGRVALDPRDQTLLLCERIDVTTIDAAAFEARVLGFVKHVALWDSGQLDDLLDGQRAPKEETLASDLSIMFRG